MEVLVVVVVVVVMVEEDVVVVEKVEVVVVELKVVVDEEVERQLSSKRNGVAADTAWDSDRSALKRTGDGHGPSVGHRCTRNRERQDDLGA